MRDREENSAQARATANNESVSGRHATSAMVSSDQQARQYRIAAAAPNTAANRQVKARGAALHARSGSASDVVVNC